MRSTFSCDSSTCFTKDVFELHTNKALTDCSSGRWHVFVHYPGKYMLLAFVVFRNLTCAPLTLFPLWLVLRLQFLSSTTIFVTGIRLVGLFDLHFILLAGWLKLRSQSINACLQTPSTETESGGAR